MSSDFFFGGGGNEEESDLRPQACKFCTSFLSPFGEFLGGGLFFLGT